MQARTQAETQLAAVQGCLAQFSRTLVVIRNLMQAGRYVDLTGLDAEMVLVCTRALALPPEEARSLRPVLLSLREELGVLAAALPVRETPPPG